MVLEKIPPSRSSNIPERRVISSNAATPLVNSSGLIPVKFAQFWIKSSSGVNPA
ncbi:hypothetical protein [Dactylococcopsis salina]|uniref:hypothetical protein n=1 Tax=Dactylococcopsis salina TaxID=292566 RepID=UPI0012EAC575|nr:hypothetical protein [Dactylococcopsis salina]